MPELAGHESSGKKTDSEQDAAGADSEATSKETLSDLEQNEEVGSSGSERDPGPSPDGELDDSDEIKDAAPM